jgi:hypothetical protein
VEAQQIRGARVVKWLSISAPGRSGSDMEAWWIGAAAMLRRSRSEPQRCGGTGIIDAVGRSRGGTADRSRDGVTEAQGSESQRRCRGAAVIWRCARSRRQLDGKRFYTSIMGQFLEKWQTHLPQFGFTHRRGSTRKACAVGVNYVVG